MRLSAADRRNKLAGRCKHCGRNRLSLIGLEDTTENRSNHFGSLEKHSLVVEQADMGVGPLPCWLIIESSLIPAAKVQHQILEVIL